MLRAHKTYPLVSIGLALTLCACATGAAEEAATPVATGSVARQGVSQGLTVTPLGQNTFRTSAQGDVTRPMEIKGRMATAANEHCAATGKRMRELSFDMQAKPGLSNYIPVAGMFAKVPGQGELTFSCEG